MVAACIDRKENEHQTFVTSKNYYADGLSQKGLELLFILTPGRS